MHAGLTWPVWKRSQRCTKARRSADAGRSPAFGNFSATYQLIAFDSQSLSVPSTSEGILPIGLIDKYLAERFSPLRVSSKCGWKVAPASRSPNAARVELPETRP